MKCYLNYAFLVPKVQICSEKRVPNVGPWPVRGQNPIPNPSYLQVSALKRWRQMCRCDILNEGQLKGPTNSFVWTMNIHAMLQMFRLCCNHLFIVLLRLAPINFIPLLSCINKSDFAPVCTSLISRRLDSKDLLLRI